MSDPNLPLDPLLQVAEVQASLRRLSDTCDALSKSIFSDPDRDAAYIFDTAALRTQFTALAAEAALMIETLEAGAGAR